MTTNYESILEKAPNLWYSLPQVAPKQLSEIPRNLSLYDDGLISVVYAPFAHINHSAKIVIVGITPGWQQAQIGYEVSIQDPTVEREVVEQRIKSQASFAGTMKTNLIQMLDGLLVHHRLKVTSTEDLFGPRYDLLHTTSMLRYPVFKNGENYSGHSPNPLKHIFLRAMIEKILVPELASVPDALVIPLGKAVERTLVHLSERGLLPINRVLRGFPHPSGANGHRKKLFELSQQHMKSQVQHWFNTI